MAHGRKSGKKFGRSFIRTQVDTTPTTAGTPAEITPVELDLQLDFESNEVFDIHYIKSKILVKAADYDSVPVTGFDMYLAISELPNMDRNIRDETVLESDPSIIFLQAEAFDVQNINSAAEEDNIVVPLSWGEMIDFRAEPYTVGDNVSVHFSATQQTEAADTKFTAIVELFGRRRRAPLKEFRELINQLRR